MPSQLRLHGFLAVRVMCAVGTCARHGLSLWEYEVVMRMHQSQAILVMPARMPRAAVPIYAPIFRANAERIYRVQPTNNSNLMFCTLLGVGKGKMCEVRQLILACIDIGLELCTTSS